MSVTVTVYYRNGLKRGPACYNAAFSQWLLTQPDKPLFPSPRKLIALPVSSKSENVYVIHPQTTPPEQPSNRVELQVTALPGEPLSPGPAQASYPEEFVADIGTAVEVWV